MLRGILLFFVCSLPIYLNAQVSSALTDPPLPQLTNCHMVLRIRELFPFPGTNRERIQRDTESVFLIGSEGWATLRFRGANGSCKGQEKLRYADGKLQSCEKHVSISPHSLFTSPQQHRHQVSSRDTWEYRQNHLFRERNYAGPGLSMTREIRYEYDAAGRVTNESYLYPPQKSIYYPDRFDAIQYEFIGDSVFQWMYRMGRIVDSMKYEARYENGKRKRWRHESKSGVQREEKNRYDSTGKILLNEWISNEPPLENGSVIRPDKIEYRYDKLGRIEEIRCFIRGLRCEAYYYTYLR